MFFVLISTGTEVKVSCQSSSYSW